MVRPVIGPLAQAVHTFVAQYHALPVPTSSRGVVLYDSAPVTGLVVAARGSPPAHVADYWADAQPWALLRESPRATCISGRDEHGEPDIVDDRRALGTLTVPTLVVAARHDVVCGVRWAEGLHKPIPASHLLVLERSGHFGHLEQPERFRRRGRRVRGCRALLIR